MTAVDLDLILLTIDRAAANPTGLDSLVVAMAPAILGSPTLLRDAVRRAWDSGLVYRPGIVAAVKMWLDGDVASGDPRMEAFLRRVMPTLSSEPRPGYEDRAVQAWRARQAERRTSGDAELHVSAAREGADEARQARLDAVPEHLRAAYEWMEGRGRWIDLDASDLEDFAYEEQERAADVGRTVPAESIVALAAWLLGVATP